MRTPKEPEDEALRDLGWTLSTRGASVGHVIVTADNLVTALDEKKKGRRELAALKRAVRAARGPRR